MTDSKTDGEENLVAIRQKSMDSGKLGAYLDRIKQAYPELGTNKAEIVMEGQNNDVLIVNDSHVFRFPRHQEATDRLETECAILNWIHPYITSAEVPAPLFSDLSPLVGEAFLGYRIIEGESGAAEEFKDNSNTSLAFQLGTFLRELHSAPVGEACGLDLPSADERERWAGMYGDVRRLLFQHMREDAKNAIKAHFELFLGDNSNFEYRPVLRHGDFGPGNLILDKETWRINGVIDFGNASVGDPAVDVAWIHFQSGVAPDFLASVYKAYPGIEEVLPRARFYAGTFALQEALFGALHGDAAAFNRGMMTYT